MTALRTKLPPRREAIPDRPLQSVQSAIRQIASDTNQRARSFPAEEYADDSAWHTTIAATSSASYLDSLEQVTLSEAAQVGDRLEIVGRANVGVAGSSAGDWQLIVYEASNTISTTKPATFWQSTSAFETFSFTAIHTVTKAGVCRIALQWKLASGAGPIYLFARGSMLVRRVRP